MKRMYDEKQVKELGAEGAVAEIAKGNVDNAKPIYWHTIRFQRGGDPSVSSSAFRVAGYLVIINNSAAEITLSDFLTILTIPGFSCLCFNGMYFGSGGVDLSGEYFPAVRLKSASASTFITIYRDANNAEVESEPLSATSASFVLFVDSVNKLN